MKSVFDEPLSGALFKTRLRPPGEQGVAVAKLTLALVHGDLARPAEARPPVGADQGFADALGNTCRYPSDLVPYKPRADVLLVGEARAPDNRSVREMRVGLRVGSLAKELAVFGDRHWEPAPDGRLVASTPAPFTSMPIRWETAAGGRGVIDNPVGIGAAPEDRTAGGRLPNIEQPDDLVTRPGQSARPAGLAPVGQIWPLRARKLGTRDEAWLYGRHPYPPEDMDPGAYNAAPEDQQVDGYLAGDEAVTLYHLDPDHPRFETRLPGMRARLYVHWAGASADQLAAHDLVCDTLWIDAAAREAVLVWRGVLPMPDGADWGRSKARLGLVPLGAALPDADGIRAAVAGPPEAPNPDAIAAMEATRKAAMATVAAGVTSAKAELADLDFPDDVAAQFAAADDPRQLVAILGGFLDGHLAEAETMVADFKEGNAGKWSARAGDVARQFGVDLPKART